MAMSNFGAFPAISFASHDSVSKQSKTWTQFVRLKRNAGGRRSSFRLISSSATVGIIHRCVATRVRSSAARLPGGGFVDSSDDVDFPKDYDELLMQAKTAAQRAIKDGNDLLEIEFPTSGLQSVSGDGEGGNEMTDSMILMRQFCDHFIPPEKSTKTRIFFPEANEAAVARESAFAGTALKLDYLTKPSLFEDFGFGRKIEMRDRVRQEDEMLLVGYPYFNVNEMLAVEELYNKAVANTDRKMIIFNGELDRIRSGYYPSLFYPKVARLSNSFLPKVETVYYVHNFKGPKGGTLFRCYPGPWKVMRKSGDRSRSKSYVCLHEQDEMPQLKDVALNILPSVSKNLR